MRDANLRVHDDISEHEDDRAHGLPAALAVVAIVAAVGLWIADPQTPRDVALTGLFLVLLAIITAGCCAYKLGDRA